MTTQKDQLRHEQAGVGFGRQQWSVQGGQPTVPAEDFMRVINGGFLHKTYSMQNNVVEDHDTNVVVVVGSCRLIQVVRKREPALKGAREPNVWPRGDVSGEKSWRQALEHHLDGRQLSVQLSRNMK